LLLIISISYNGIAEGVFKLYPLIVLTSAAIIFIILYFLRGILLSYDDARCIGLFSKKDYARYEKDYHLRLTLLGHGRLLVEVFGYPKADDVGFDWYKGDSAAEINLFRARANGGPGTVKRILQYYGFDCEEAARFITDEEYSGEAKDVFAAVVINEETKKRCVTITFKELFVNKNEEE
jgi:hypothetical protein